MLNKHSIESGDACTNLQISQLTLQNLSGDEIKEIQDKLIQFLLSQAQKERELSRLPGKSQDIAQVLLEIEEGESIDPEILISLLKQWRPSQPDAQRKEVLNKIIFYGIPAILQNQKLAIFIMEQARCHNLLKTIIIPSCKLSCEENVSLSELKNFIRASINNQISPGQLLSLPHQRYLIKVLYSVIYQNLTESNYKEISQLIASIPASKNALLESFFFDAFFRVRSNYLFINQLLDQQIEGYANDFFQKYPDSPLTYLRRTIISPLNIYQQYDFETIIADLSRIAQLCQYTIEAKWIVSALYKILPLYKTEDIDYDYDEANEKVISSFDTKILSKFSYLRYVDLKKDIYLFQKTSKTRYLIRYEKNFVIVKDSLPVYQQLVLQIEYASAIYLYLINNDIKTLANTKLLEFSELDVQNLIDKTLFANILIWTEGSLRSPPNYANKGLLLKWLFDYINIIFKLFALKELATNPFKIFSYRAASQVPMIKAQLDPLIVKFISEIPKENITQSPSYANKIIALVEFLKIGKQFECEQLLKWVEHALESSQYEVLINAKSIAYILYYIHFYCDESLQISVNTLSTKFSQLSISRNHAPRLYWATMSCMAFSDSPKEQELILSIYNSLSRVNKKIFQLAPGKYNQFELTIPNEVIDLFRLNAEKGSMLALVGVDYLLVPEYWNLLGTTIFNLAFPNLTTSCDISSLFYSVAKCFAREQRVIEQKYSYNYIRTRSLYYKHSGLVPPIGFFFDCSYFLSMTKNQNFYYKTTCCRPFFELLKEYYDQLPQKFHELYEKQILPQRYWVKKEFSKMNIGVFKDEIRIA